jgi:hypothetical protein
MGIGFHHLPLDYDPFESFQLKMSKNLKFTGASHITHLSYSFIIEKNFYEAVVSRFNFGKCQVFDLHDKLVDTENEYYFIWYYYNNFQDLEFEKCEYKYYNRNTRDFEKNKIQLKSKEAFQNYKMEKMGQTNLDLRVDKHVFYESFHAYDILVLNELENVATNFKFSADLMKYLKEQKVKCLFSSPINIYYYK